MFKKQFGRLENTVVKITHNTHKPHMIADATASCLRFLIKKNCNSKVNQKLKFESYF